MPPLKNRFTECLKFVFEQEGGFDDDKDDPGGRTNLGITQDEYNMWRHGKSEPQRDVAKITLDEATAIYEAKYWDVCHCDTIPAPLDLAVFDCGVNQGNGRAMAFLAIALGMPAQSHWSDALAMRVKGIAVPSKVVGAYIAERLANYHHTIEVNPKLGKFEDGWENRLHALKIATGLITA